MVWHRLVFRTKRAGMGVRKRLAAAAAREVNRSEAAVRQSVSQNTKCGGLTWVYEDMGIIEDHGNATQRKHEQKY
eukprot:g48969.t1